MIKLAIVLGTRPEILKFAPIIDELKKRQIKHKIFFTRQHFTANMGQNFFKELDINISEEFPYDFDRDVVDIWIKTKLKEYKPDCVLVQGDTKTALTATLASVFLKIPVAHIEAGLRSFNFSEPFPEELNRTLIDAVSTYLFCPTKNNKNNLVIKKHDGQKAFVTGNTIIDLIKTAKQDVTYSNQILITMHRRDNWTRINEICSGLDWLAENHPKYKFIFVKHANKTISEKIKARLLPSKITIIPPQPYLEFMKLMATSKLIITDSGGLVEEASALRIPTVVIREATERQEAMDIGCSVLAGTNGGQVLDAVHNILINPSVWKKMSDCKCPFGDGKASKLIVNILERELTR